MQALKLQGPVPEKCTPAVMAAVIKQHLDASSMWAIFPLQDMMGLSSSYSQRPAAEETINDPTNPRHYWRFRVHVCLEDLLADGKFLGDLQTLLLGEHCGPESAGWLRAGGREIVSCGSCLGGPSSKRDRVFFPLSRSMSPSRCGEV